MMNCVNKMVLPPDSMQNINNLKDNKSMENSIEGFDATPEWIAVFTIELLKINGYRCPEKLDRMMNKYLELMRDELIKCEASPNHSYHMANKMEKMLTYFYGYYRDLRQGNEEHILHTFLKTPMLNHKCKSIYDLIFRKVLVTNRTNHSQADTGLEYIRNLLCFKLWKNTYPKSMKQMITDYALAYNKPPSNLSRYIQKIRFIPKSIDHSDLHKRLCTIPLQIDDGIREYFERIKINNKNVVSFKAKEKTSFISRLFDVFSNIDSNTDNGESSFIDNLMLDQIKKETEEIYIEDDNSDDDCVFVDPNAPPPPLPVVETPLDNLIDLTNNEPNIRNGEPTDLTPMWCLRFLKQVNMAGKEQPHSLDAAVCVPENMCTPIEVQAEYSTCMELETENHKLGDCKLTNKLTDSQPVYKLDIETVHKMKLAGYKTDFSMVNGCLSVDFPIDWEPVNKLSNCRPVNQKSTEFTNCKLVDSKHIRDTVKCTPTSSHSGDYQTVNGTTEHCKPVDVPKLKSVAVSNIISRKLIDCNVNKDFELDNTYFEPEYLQLMQCEPVIYNQSNSINEKSVNCNLTNGYSVKVVNNNCSTVGEAANTAIEDGSSAVAGPIDTSIEEYCSRIAHSGNTTIADYLNDFPDELETCVPITCNINRANINNMPLVINDDVCVSEVKNGLSGCDIASTSNNFAPVILQSLSVQGREKIQRPMRNLLPTTSKLQLRLNAALNDSNQSFNSSTKSPSCESSKLRYADSVAAISSGIPSHIIKNYTTKNSTNRFIEVCTSTPKMQTEVHDSSKIVQKLSNIYDATSENNLITDDLVINSRDIELENQLDAEEIEPASGNACFFSQFTSENNLQTQNSSTPHVEPVLVEEPRVNIATVSERRVPKNGKKEKPDYFKILKLSKKECQLFTPQVIVCNGNTSGTASGTPVRGGCAMQTLYSQRYYYKKIQPCAIIERQDFFKDDIPARALIYKRTLRSQSVSRNYDETSTSEEPAATNQGRKRGTRNSNTEAKKKRK